MGGHGLVEEHSLQVLPHLLGKSLVLVLLEVEVGEGTLAFGIPAALLVGDVIEADALVVVAVTFSHYLRHFGLVDLYGFEKIRD